MKSLRDDITDLVQAVDGDSGLSAPQLGSEIARFLMTRGAVSDEATGNAIEDFTHDATLASGTCTRSG